MSVPAAWWACACGWRGGPDDLRVGPGRIKVCPMRDCGGSGSLQIYTLCPYCGTRAECVPDPDQMYPEHVIWRCVPCGAHVGCHAGTCAPLGTLADAATRALRVAAHQEFDLIWLEGAERAGVYRTRARRCAYRWLAAHLDISEANCHVAMFDAARCHKALAFLDGKKWAHVELWRDRQTPVQSIDDQTSG